MPAPETRDSLDQLVHRHREELLDLMAGAARRDETFSGIGDCDCDNCNNPDPCCTNCAEGNCCPSAELDQWGEAKPTTSLRSPFGCRNIRSPATPRR